MRDQTRRELVARLLLTLATLAPYWQLLTLRVIHVTDDVFASDVWNGELPGRVLAGRLLRQGVWQTWSSEGCCGAPAIVSEPLSALLFAALPPWAALDLLLVIWILLAAHGSYGLARHLGAARPGAWLCGYAFAVSGYMVTQLKHLSIIGTVVWLPWGLLILARALAHDSFARRVLCFALFAGVVGEQALTGFPQSLYICGLAYGAFALYCVLAQPATAGESRVRRAILPLLGAALALVLGLLAGAAMLLPLAELGSVSDRGAGNSFEWATVNRYWPPNVLTFLVPYLHGDVSDNSYRGPSIFWEDYAYVGLLTFLLAVYAVVRGRRDGRVLFFGAVALGAYVIALGPATPVFRLAFDHLPLFDLFRLPTRFLVVVDLCLCLLAALGLSMLHDALAHVLRSPRAARVLPLVGVGACAVVFLDLLAHQPRQNPMVDGPAWLEPPFTVRALQAEPGPKRVFTPYHMQFHESVYDAARGWADLRPYYALREIVQPNTNMYWGIASADCYAGISARWYIDAWGDHNRPSRLVYPLMRPRLDQQRLQTAPALLPVLRTFGVTHLISPLRVPALEPELPTAAPPEDRVHVYRVPRSGRVRVVEHARVASETRAIIRELTDPAFDPDRVVILSDVSAALATPRPISAAPSDVSATLERDDGDTVVVRTRAPRGGFLVLADTFYPDWTASVDGAPAPIHRANLYVRAVPLEAGARRVVFQHRAQAQHRGRAISLAAVGVLIGAIAWAWLRLRRQRVEGSLT